MSRSCARQTRAVRRSSTCGRTGNAAALDVARDLCRDAWSAESTLELESWVSWLYGELWQNRARVPADHPEGFELALGRQIVEAIAAVGGSEGLLALTAIARLDRGDLGGHAYLLGAEMHEYDLPDHVHSVGRATVVRAAATYHDRDSGQGVLLEARAADGSTHTIATFIDDRLGAIAKSAHLLYGFDTIQAYENERSATLDVESNWERFGFVEVDPSEACRNARESILRTDLLEAPPVDEGYARLRALAFARACTVA